LFLYYVQINSENNFKLVLKTWKYVRAYNYTKIILNIRKYARKVTLNTILIKYDFCFNITRLKAYNYLVCGKRNANCIREKKCIYKEH